MAADPIDLNNSGQSDGETANSPEKQAHSGQTAVPSKIRFGAMKGKIWIADDFDAPLPEEILAEFEADIKQ